MVANGERYSKPRISTAGGWLTPSPAMKRPGKASPIVRMAELVLSGSLPQMLAMPVAITSVSVAPSNVAARVNASLPPGASPNQSAPYPSRSSSRALARSSSAGKP